tara:strand:+ start:127 stop:690 length:564 start_codon:yes stop_codon:yes gene_type:complete
MTEENKTQDEQKPEEVKEETPKATDDKPAKEEKQAEVSAPESKKEETPAEAPAVAEEKATTEVPDKFKALVEQIENLSVLELSELVKVLEEKFGVSAAAPAVAVAAGAPAGEAVAEEKSAFDIELASFGDNKIAVIKVVKEITGLGLKDAKDMVDAAPKVLKEGVKKEEAEEMKNKLVEAGASVNLK